MTVVPEGAALAWRPETAWLLHRRQNLAFTEVVAEAVPPKSLPRPIEQLRDRGVTVVPHGVSLSLGGAEGYSERALDHLARVAERLHAPIVSEHIAFVRAGGVEAGHLLPVARTARMLDRLTENVLAAQRVLPVPLALEPIATLFEWPHSEMDEASFVRALLDRTGCRLVLDLANLHTNHVNHGWEPGRFLANLTPDDVAYVHIAGGWYDGELYHDTHASLVADPVYDLLRQALDQFGPLSVLIERDDHFGTRPALQAELDRVAALVETSRAVDAPERPPPSKPAWAGSPRASEDVSAQGALVRSLVVGGAPPEGFDRRRLGAAASALERKAARARTKHLRSVERHSAAVSDRRGWWQR